MRASWLFCTAGSRGSGSATETFSGLVVACSTVASGGEVTVLATVLGATVLGAIDSGTVSVVVGGVVGHAMVRSR